MSKGGFKAKATVEAIDPKSFFPGFVKAARVAADELTREAAKEAAESLKQIILEQKYKWKPLSAPYRRWKKLAGRDERILISTGEFVASIGWWEDEHGVHVGFRAQAEHRESSLPLNYLARIHEFGSAARGIPARPLWRPALSAFLRRHKEFARRLRISAAKNLKKSRAAQRKLRKEIRG